MNTRKTLMLSIALLLCAGLLLSACSRAPGPSGNVIGNGTIEAEKKTAQEQHNETLMAVVPDGTYTEDATYNYHSGSERVTISVTIEDNVVTAASVVGNDPNPVSSRYINGVNDALPSLVVGKRIDEIDLPRQISGSSLTAGALRQHLEGLPLQ